MKLDLYTKIVLTTAELLSVSAGVAFFFLMNAVAQQPRPASPTSASVQRVADQFMDRLLVKCGDSHFVAFNQYSGYRGVGLFEYKDLSTKLVPTPLSQADRLNGYEWRLGRRFQAA